MYVRTRERLRLSKVFMRKWGRSEFYRNTPTYRRNTMATVSITSNEGTFDSASAVLEVTATNPEYNQPALRIKQAGKRWGAASIG